MGFKLVTPASDLAISVATLRVQSKTDVVADEDALLEQYIRAATADAEHRMGRAVLPQTWELYLDAWPDVITLRYPPIVAVDWVKYVDTAGMLQDLSAANYELDQYLDPGFVFIVSGQSWPLAMNRPNCVRVRFRCGYATPSDVPAPIKQWITMRAASMYQNREDVQLVSQVQTVPFHEHMLDRYRVYEGI
jgi:uncharacterized phiE125 gp8 family phage protein